MNRRYISVAIAIAIIIAVIFALATLKNPKINEKEDNNAPITIIDEKTNYDKIAQELGFNYHIGIRTNDSTKDFETINICVTVNKNIKELSTLDAEAIHSKMIEHLHKDSQILSEQIVSYQQIETKITTVEGVKTYFVKGIVDGKSFMIMYMLKPTDFTGLKDLASEEGINKNPEVYDKLDGWNGIIAIFAIANTSESKLVDNLWYYYN